MVLRPVNQCGYIRASWTSSNSTNESCAVRNESNFGFGLVNCEGHKTLSTLRPQRLEETLEASWSRRNQTKVLQLSYQPNAVTLGQAGSQNHSHLISHQRKPAHPHVGQSQYRDCIHCEWLSTPKFTFAGTRLSGWPPVEPFGMLPMHTPSVPFRQRPPKGLGKW